jgi:hypothetical protein
VGGGLVQAPKATACLRSIAAASLSLLLACGGQGGGAGGGKAEPAPQPAGDGFESSWLGHLSRTYPGSLAECTDGAKAALRRLQIDVTEEKPGLFETTLEAEGRDGTSLVLIAKEVTRDSTRIAVKVGYLLGDRDAARRIHSEIESELKARRDEETVRRQRWGGGGATTATPTTRPPSGS